MAILALWLTDHWKVDAKHATAVAWAVTIVAIALVGGLAWLLFNGG